MSDGSRGNSRRVGVPVVLAAAGLALGALQMASAPTSRLGAVTNDGRASLAVDGSGHGDEQRKAMAMGNEEEIAAAEADLQAAQAQLQSKLTRSLPGGVSIAKPEVGMELKRLREDVEAKQRRLDALKKD